MAQKLSNLPIGAKIKFGKHQVASETALPIIWVVADKNHSGYPTDSVTLITEKIIDLRPYDAAEPTTTYPNGNVDYGLSNINQWLNSAASAGKWYSPTHTNDTPPSSPNVSDYAYTARAGFLYNFQEFERLALLPTTLTIQTGSNVNNKITTKVFLPSEWEILGTGSVADGSSRLTYFKTSPDEAVMTNQAFTNVSNKSNKPDAVTDPWYYLLRSTTATHVKNLQETGVGTDHANNPYMGVRPIVNLSSTCKIKDTPDADGCYSLVANNLPILTGTNVNLGTIDTDLGDAVLGFTHPYTIEDADTTEVLTATEYIDNIKVRSYEVKTKSNTFDVTGNTWLKLANGTHTLKITVTDGYDIVTGTITFVKSVNKIVVQRSTPILASTKPSQIIVDVVKTIPYNAIMEVFVTNNGFDAKPIWDKLDTSSISTGLAHEFSNGKDGTTPVCTAGKWGVNIRVTIERGEGEGACYISEIGGNFE